MFIAFIISIIIPILIIFTRYRRMGYYDELALTLSMIWITLSIILFVNMFKWQMSSDIYTGYIYSRDSKFGYTTYHIRYSLNAGDDQQPSFTVKSGSSQEAELDKLVGSDTKVVIKVPSN